MLIKDRRAAASGGRVAGNLLAFAMAVLMSIVLVLIRRNPGISMLPVARPLAASGEAPSSLRRWFATSRSAVHKRR